MDHVFAGFLERQLEEGMALAARSSLLTLEPLGGALPDRYAAHFACRGLVRAPSGEIVEAEGCDVGIWFPQDYLDRANPIEVVTWLSPREAFHPNIGPGPGDRIFICIGHLQEGTSLFSILLQCFEIVTYQKVTMLESDALNHEACAWARANQQRFPIDRRTLLGGTIVRRDHTSPSEARP